MKIVNGSFVKFDDEQRIVEGYASTEALDAHGEIISKEAIQNALDDYLKFANIREMHQPIAAGRCIDARIDDVGLYITVQVVEEMTWKKIKAKVLNGFSVGGKVLEKIDNVITRMTLSEISLVDRPANPLSVITMWKCDAEQTTEFKQEDLQKGDEMKPEDQKEEVISKMDEEKIEDTEKMSEEVKEEEPEINDEVKEFKAEDKPAEGDFELECAEKLVSMFKDGQIKASDVLRMIEEDMSKEEVDTNDEVQEDAEAKEEKSDDVEDAEKMSDETEEKSYDDKEKKEEVEKSESADDIQKAELKTDDRLEKALIQMNQLINDRAQEIEKMNSLNNTIAQLTEKVKVLEAMPAAPKGFKTVDKNEGEEVAKSLSEKKTKVDDEMVKLATNILKRL